jgi:GH24 family phage-related lysozyme (muramidase)
MAKTQQQIDQRQAQRLERGRKIALLRQTAAVGIVSGTFATFSALSNFTFSANASDKITDTSNNNDAPLRPLPETTTSFRMEDPVLVQGRAVAVRQAQQQATAQPTSSQQQPQQQIQAAAPAMDVVFEDFIDHLLEREGFENEVYKDTLGVLTVGVGHRVLPQDNLREGQTISNERVRQFLYKDAQKAFYAAREQASELGVSDPEFLVALASVNFQLGTGWNDIHRKTWRLMTEGRFREAADEASRSRWNQQTPVRVRDFQNALRALEPAPAVAQVKSRKLSMTFEDRVILPADEETSCKMHSYAIGDYETNGASVLVLAA